MNPSPVLAVQAYEGLVLAGLAADAGAGDDAAAGAAESLRFEAGIGDRLARRDDGELGEAVGEVEEGTIEAVRRAEVARFAAEAEVESRGVERGDRSEPRATRRQGRPEGLPIGAERRDDADAGDGDPAVVQGQFPPAGASPPSAGSAASAALTASIT